MDQLNWSEEFPAAITVCDAEGTILELNDRACATFAEEGGAGLIGRNLLTCHPAPARAKLEELLRSASTNCYTIEKRGVKKLIYQAPWYEKGKYRGLVEISIPIPAEIPHFIRE